jgi:hypothetical protein
MSKDNRTIVKAHSEGQVKNISAKGFWRVDHKGEGSLSRESGLEGVNRKDTTIQLTTGGPVVLNKDETIFTVRKGRPVNEGQTLRQQTYPEGEKTPP